MMKNIVPNENCLTEAQLLQYLRDECTAAEEKAIDRHLTHCPMCSDALEGTMLLNSSRLERSLGHLDVKIETLFSEKKQVEHKAAAVIAEEPIMTVVKSPRKLTWLWAAASVAILAAVGLWFFTQPMNYDVASPVASETPNATLPDTQTTATNAHLEQTEGTQNTNPTGTTNNNQPLSTNKEITEKPFANSTTNNRPADVAAAPAQPTTSKPMNTEGTSAKSKEEETKLDEVSVADTYNNTRQKETTAQNAAAEPNINNYPGAAAQNNAPTANQTRAAKVKPSPDNGLIEYQTGMRLYQKGAYNEAIAPLNRFLAKQNNADLYQNALWSLANSYLKVGKKQDAQILLQRIVSEKGKYAEQAANLMK